jgi:hypothetical protein
MEKGVIMATNTAINVGVRRMIRSLPTPQYRNYEPKGGQLYNAVQDNLEYAGVTYQKGQTIPYDGGGGTYYCNDALMEVYFNAEMIDPAS